jgi:chromosomal replication initiation ATPase DnaA
MKANYEIKKVGYIEPRPNTSVTLEGLLEIVCEVQGVTVNQMKGSSRQRNIAYARHIFNYYAYYYTTNTYKQIGLFLGNRHHSTVIHGKDICMDLATCDKPFKRVYDDVGVEFYKKYGAVSKYEKIKEVEYVSPFNQ